jgi:hypothetical protein
MTRTTTILCMVFIALCGAAWAILTAIADPNPRRVMKIEDRVPFEQTHIVLPQESTGAQNLSAAPLPQDSPTTSESLVFSNRDPLKITAPATQPGN